MIIDTHTHFYDPSRPQGVPWPPLENELLYRTVLPHHYKALAVPEGVTGTIVVEASSWLEDNQWILDLAAAEPFILGLVGHIGPDREAFRDELNRFVHNPAFLGIRCWGWRFEDVDKGSFVSDMEALAQRGLALDVLIRPPQVDGLLALADRIPKLRIVVDHIAHMPIDGQALDPSWIEVYRQLAARPNVYIKVSALMEMSTVQPAPLQVDHYRPTLDALWEAFGQDRLIYGSNWPVCERAGTFAQGLDIVRTYFAGQGREATERYFHRNAQAAYGV